MTRIDFYIVEDRDPQSRIRLALRLTDKAHRAGHRVFILAESESQARDLDRELWSFRPASFLPHALFSEEPTEQICLAWGQEPQQHDDLLINLQTERARLCGTLSSRRRTGQRRTGATCCTSHFLALLPRPGLRVGTSPIVERIIARPRQAAN